jgi:hypothetical protein
MTGQLEDRWQPVINVSAPSTLIPATRHFLPAFGFLERNFILKFVNDRHLCLATNSTPFDCNGHLRIGREIQPGLHKKTGGLLEPSAFFDWFVE